MNSDEDDAMIDKDVVAEIRRRHSKTICGLTLSPEGDAFVRLSPEETAQQIERLEQAKAKLEKTIRLRADWFRAHRT